MGTPGNLELRMYERTLYASTTHDGYRVYEAIPRLVDFLDALKDPSKEQLSKWFRGMSKKLLPANYSENLIGAATNEIIIDFPRKLVLHTGSEDYYEWVSEDFPAKFKDACNTLKAKYNYEFLYYALPEIRKK